MSFDLPFWTSIGRAARSWGLAALALAVIGLAVADWAATRLAPSLTADDIITGSVGGAQRPKERTTRIIRSVLSDQPIVIRQ